MKFNTKPFNKKAPIEPLKYKDLYKKWWSCLETVAFGNTERFLAYEEHKHNFGSRYPRDVFLLTDLVLGMTHIEKFLEILEHIHYMVGRSYNCEKFIKDMNKGFQVSVEVNFVKLDSKSDIFGLQDIEFLLNDKDRKLRNFCLKRKNKIDKTSEFFLEDFCNEREGRFLQRA
ncbi:hypothetical protein POM88_002049 [Heracleum sosnowskyi]|uniref:Uncharacterized protein n=1 Tax=Heracleum sosnowskyi TaxID=360622 RepID=A0AAD8JE28_9APIA|nr:hypothetical protein POM88_002049 [Heracleum sosnowskyi]